MAKKRATKKKSTAKKKAPAKLKSKLKRSNGVHNVEHCSKSESAMEKKQKTIKNQGYSSHVVERGGGYCATRGPALPGPKARAARKAYLAKKKK